jgi:hypothetical protein
MNFSKTIGIGCVVSRFEQILFGTFQRGLGHPKTALVFELEPFKLLRFGNPGAEGAFRRVKPALESSCIKKEAIPVRYSLLNSLKNPDIKL